MWKERLTNSSLFCTIIGDYAKLWRMHPISASSKTFCTDSLSLTKNGNTSHFVSIQIPIHSCLCYWTKLTCFSRWWWGRESSRASFLIVPCTALQWRAHQSCLQLEQNNIVTAATAPKRRKDFSRFSILVQVIEGEISLKSPLNCQRKAELLSFSYRSNLPSYSVIHKLTLNSWVFLKTSYLPVPQDSSLAGKLEISNFLRRSNCFLRRRGTC